jgi:hypothetical protein
MEESCDRSEVNASSTKIKVMTFGSTWWGDYEDTVPKLPTVVTFIAPPSTAAWVGVGVGGWVASDAPPPSGPAPYAPSAPPSAGVEQDRIASLESAISSHEARNTTYEHDMKALREENKVLQLRLAAARTAKVTPEDHTHRKDGISALALSEAEIKAGQERDVQVQGCRCRCTVQ